MAFDPRQAQALTELLQQGLTLRQAATAAGISPEDLGNFQETDAAQVVALGSLRVEDTAPPAVPVQVDARSGIERDSATDTVVAQDQAAIVIPPVFTNAPPPPQRPVQLNLRTGIERDAVSGETLAQDLTAVVIADSLQRPNIEPGLAVPADASPEAQLILQQQLQIPPVAARAAQPVTITEVTQPLVTPPAITVVAQPPTPQGDVLVAPLAAVTAPSPQAIAAQDPAAQPLPQPVLAPTAVVASADSIGTTGDPLADNVVAAATLTTDIASRLVRLPNTVAPDSDPTAAVTAQGITDILRQAPALVDATIDPNASTLQNFLNTAQRTAQAVAAGSPVSGALNLLSNLTNSRQQQELGQQRREVNLDDWRVRISLAEEADYLYQDPSITQNDLLWPLRVTNGVLFPYTPNITTTYSANYNPISLTHSNHLSYFYQNSSVGAINVTATFTAQDTAEANYLLAVIHFFRSATKMFYGQDALAGAPPPVLFLSGFGENQFARHPVLLNTFNYTLPENVDYVRAGSFNVNGSTLLTRRTRDTLPSNSFDSALRRLQTLGQQLGLIKGADPKTVAQSFSQNLGGDRPTYVPTQIEVTIVLLPVQTRKQVSEEFSVKLFAQGNLLRGGYW